MFFVLAFLGLCRPQTVRKGLYKTSFPFVNGQIAGQVSAPSRVLNDRQYGKETPHKFTTE
jgi:hypothetical protein